jgi:hypothetical protein
MSDEFRNDEFEQSPDSMQVVDGEKLSEPEISIRQDENAPRADAYPQADEYQQHQEYYQQKQEAYRRQQEAYEQQDRYRQQSYGQQDYRQRGAYRQQYYGQAERQKSESTGFGIASMVLGIVSLLMFCTCINYILAILAIIFGIIQLVRSEKKGMAIAGIVTAGLSVVLASLMWIGFMAMTFESEDGANPFNSYLEEYYEQYYDNDGAF